MPLKEIYPKEDFWLKIHMKDHVWDDVDNFLQKSKKYFTFYLENSKQ